ncbi:endosialidase [Butyrivibrio sp. CB08]|uniref:endosialidase n=1 Tax=Butyrivibrio sp. CB08 TaxID=2364879 RepID=UPI000EA8D592|nr:endosialidase [Butyrivibrio sp. CB08]RKM61213.1 endosialidase [Butyrivibrio sp. CB08]
MAVVEQLIRAESDGSISFGNYKLPEKTKLENFEHNGNILKVKTFKDITKLEKDENFVYESVPGTAVTSFTETDKGVEFKVEGATDAQITLGLNENTEYSVFVNGSSIGKMSTGLGGKLNLSVELSEDAPTTVKVEM